MKSYIAVAVTDEPFDANAAIAAFSREFPAGAVVSFVGHVRPASDGERVEKFFLDHYPSFTEQTIRQFAEQAAGRWPIDAVSIIHRVGKLAPEEPIVFVAAAADHRRAAFEAVDFLMDYLKTSAPFWKCERTAAGVQWIEPRAEDYADKNRWE